MFLAIRAVYKSSITDCDRDSGVTAGSFHFIVPARAQVCLIAGLIGAPLMAELLTLKLLK